MRRPRGVSASALLVLCVAAAAPLAARDDQIFMLGNLAGLQTVTHSSGVTRAEYSFNDRGRGDHIIATWKLDAAGVPIEYQGSGNDYVKAPVSETFRLTGGKATWRNRAEQGEKAQRGEAFYPPVNGPPNPTAVTPGLEQIAPRMPAQVRRGMLSGALSVPKGEEAAYGEALPAMLRLVKALYDAGVTIIPGTDSFAGYELHHELELYVRAGIPPAEVLRLATLTSAQVIGADGERGVIAPGKLADLILVDGDPSAQIADIDKLVMVIKGGRIHQPARIEQALGIAPRDRT